ncbi:MAG: hypothetical protein AUG51_13655 [Acidobacteria bacterium 13_1_20CM_3_53_8]|nr:MAG: hypothetical protein AUG51_13655 [Acidobacteria bacterium 13_1_20CM_3_53_8]
MIARIARKIFCLLLALVTLALCSSCRSTAGDNSGGVIVVNSPATGEVKRILVVEGTKVDAGTPIIEIAVQNETPTVTPSLGESAESRASRTLVASNAEIEAARAEVVRHEAEVQRLTPLVASGEASQAQLDGERALYDRAQQRLQKAQAAAREAESGLIAARQPGVNQQTSAVATPTVQIVNATATSAGTVSVISARVGQRVTMGQPLATIRADD